MTYFDDTTYRVVDGNIVYAKDLNNPLAALKTGLESLTDDVRTGSKIKYGPDTGTANNYKVNLDPAPTSYTDGLEVWLKPANTNTGSAVLNVSTLGDIPIKRPGNLDLQADDIKTGYFIKLKYSAGVFQIVSNMTYPASVVDEIEAKRQEVSSNTAQVEADKDTVANDKATVQALAGDMPDISTATPGQSPVVNDAKDGYDLTWVGLGKMPTGVEMEGLFVGGDYWNGTDAVNDIDIQPFVFPSHDNTDVISSTAVITAATDASGANGMLGGAKQANDVLDMWALKGSSGTCVGFTRNGYETIDGVTLPDGYSDTYKWVGTTGKLNVTDLPSIVCIGDLFSYLDSTEAIFFNGVVGTTYVSYSLSGMLPDDRYTECLFGAYYVSTTTALQYWSVDGITDYTLSVTADAQDFPWYFSGYADPRTMPIKNNQVHTKQDIAQDVKLLLQSAKLRR